MSRLSVSAPAKVNLHLQVLGRRPDGFHEVRTLLQSVDWCDELEAESAPVGELSLEVEPADAAPEGDDNLVLRAARCLWGRLGERPGARLRLSKRIPAGAGLGGGSADAAAALVLLDRLWSVGLAQDDLHAMASALGSDVPFFLQGGLALGVGRGEEVYRLPDLPATDVVVAVPPLSLATAAVYRRLPPQLTWRPTDVTVYAFAAGLAAEPCWDSFYNDLQSVVLEGWPAVASVVEYLRGCGPLLAAVTGSGAAAFALFRDRAGAIRAAESAPGSCRVHRGTTLGRDSARLQVREG